MKTTFITTLLLITAGCIAINAHADITRPLTEYINTKDATIGVAVITCQGDTSGINMHKLFPMASVMKFPLALAVADKLRKENVGIDTPISANMSIYPTDTHSPMLDKYNSSHAVIPISELMAYTLQQSDNNACDILIDYVGGVNEIQNTLSCSGITDIYVRHDEAKMLEQPELNRDNCASPLALAKLLNRFYTTSSDTIALKIKQLMETCVTGKDRIPLPLSGTNAIIGHKTGTGPHDSCTNRLMALNDAAYIHMPDGFNYTLVVFISDSKYDITQTSDIIANISRIVFENIRKQ